MKVSRTMGYNAHASGLFAVRVASCLVLNIVVCLRISIC
jgi:hypothetical protein